MGPFKTYFLLAGLAIALTMYWNVQSDYAPPVNHYETPDCASEGDKRILEGSRHVAPFAAKQWQQEKALEREAAAAYAQAAMRAAGQATPSRGQGYHSDYGMPPSAGTSHYQQATDQNRLRMIVRR